MIGRVDEDERRVAALEDRVNKHTPRVFVTHEGEKEKREGVRE